MDTNDVKIDKITADLEKKYTGDPDHDVGVIQAYCNTLPRCAESARLVAALGRYAAEKFPTAKAIQIAKVIDEAIQTLEKQFNGDADHDVELVQAYCKSLPQTEDNFKVVLALGQYAAAKYPNAKEIQRSREDFKRMSDEAGKLKQRVAAIQELVRDNKKDEAIAEIQAILNEHKLPTNSPNRLISFSHPFEECLFNEYYKGTKSLMRISNLPEMLNLQLGSLLADAEKYDDAKDAIQKTIDLNPVSAPAHIEMAHIALLEKDYDDAYNWLQKAYPLLFNPQMIAIYFAFLANVVENLDKNYPLAAAFAHLSLSYFDNPPAHDMLDRLAKEHGVDTNKPSDETIEKLAEEADLPVAACPQVCEIATRVGREIKAANPEISKLFLTIAYELTHDEALHKEIQ